MFATSLGDGASLRPLEPWHVAQFLAHQQRARDHIAPWVVWSILPREWPGLTQTSGPAQTSGPTSASGPAQASAPASASGPASVEEDGRVLAAPVP